GVLLPAPLEALLLLLLLIGGALFLTVWLLAGRYRQALRELTQRVVALREKPSHQPGDDEDKDPVLPELRAVYAQLDDLGACYRQALADGVAQAESLEALRTVLGRIDAEKGRSFTLIQRASGSSRNMVARLAPNLRWMTATPALQQFLGYSLPELNARSFL